MTLKSITLIAFYIFTGFVITSCEVDSAVDEDLLSIVGGPEEEVVEPEIEKIGKNLVADWTLVDFSFQNEFVTVDLGPSTYQLRIDTTLDNILSLTSLTGEYTLIGSDGVEKTFTDIDDLESFPDLKATGDAIIGSFTETVDGVDNLRVLEIISLTEISLILKLEVDSEEEIYTFSRERLVTDPEVSIGLTTNANIPGLWDLVDATYESPLITGNLLASSYIMEISQDTDNNNLSFTNAEGFIAIEGQRDRFSTIAEILEFRALFGGGVLRARGSGLISLTRDADGNTIATLKIDELTQKSLTISVIAENTNNSYTFSRNVASAEPAAIAAAAIVAEQSTIATQAAEAATTALAEFETLIATIGVNTLTETEEVLEALENITDQVTIATEAAAIAIGQVSVAETQASVAETEIAEQAVAEAIASATTIPEQVKIATEAILSGTQTTADILVVSALQTASQAQIEAIAAVAAATAATTDEELETAIETALETIITAEAAATAAETAATAAQTAAEAAATAAEAATALANVEGTTQAAAAAAETAAATAATAAETAAATAAEAAATATATEEIVGASDIIADALAAAALIDPTTEEEIVIGLGDSANIPGSWDLVALTSNTASITGDLDTSSYVVTISQNTEDRNILTFVESGSFTIENQSETFTTIADIVDFRSLHGGGLFRARTSGLISIGRPADDNDISLIINRFTKNFLVITITNVDETINNSYTFKRIESERIE